MIRFG